MFCCCSAWKLVVAKKQGGYYSAINSGTKFCNHNLFLLFIAFIIKALRSFAFHTLNLKLFEGSAPTLIPHGWNYPNCNTEVVAIDYCHSHLAVFLASQSSPFYFPTFQTIPAGFNISLSLRAQPP